MIRVSAVALILSVLLFIPGGDKPPFPTSDAAETSRVSVTSSQETMTGSMDIYDLPGFEGYLNALYVDPNWMPSAMDAIDPFTTEVASRIEILRFASDADAENGLNALITHLEDTSEDATDFQLTRNGDEATFTYSHILYSELRMPIPATGVLVRDGSTIWSVVAFGNTDSPLPGETVGFLSEQQIPADSAQLSDVLPAPGEVHGMENLVPLNDMFAASERD